MTWHRRIAVGTALVGVFLPAGVAAAFLVGSGTPPAGTVTTGLWIFKATLLLHAGLFWMAPRIETGRSPGSLLPDLASSADDGTPAESPDRRLELAVLAALVAAALALRLPQLDAGMWFDEIQTLVSYVRASPGEIVVSYDSTNQHLLYSLAAGASVAGLGESPAALRLPAVLFGAASVWAVWWLGRRLVAGREAVLAAALLAFSYHHVWFSQNARGYTALLFWTLISTALLVDMLRTTTFSWRLLAAYAASTALGVYTHLTAGAVLAGHGIVVGGLCLRKPGTEVRAARRTALTGLVLAGSLTLLLYAPVLPQVWETLSAPTMPGVAVEWESPLWLLTETATGLARGLPGGFVALAGGGLLGLVGLVGYWRRCRAVTAAMLLPGLLVLTAALFRNHNLWPRFFFFSAGFGVLVLVRGVFAGAGALATLARLDGERARSVATALVAVLAVGSAVTVPGAWGPKQDFRGADRFVSEAKEPGDAVVALDMAGLPLRGYLGRSYHSVTSLGALGRIESSHSATWVVYTFPTRVAATYPEIWSRLQSRYEEVAEFPGTVRGGTIVVMRRS